MTKKDSGHHKKDHKGDHKKGGHGGHGSHGGHNVVPHHKKVEKQHNKEHDPIYIGTGEVKPHLLLSDNLSKKDRHMVEKLEAQIEYAEAHDKPGEAQKLRDQIETINDKADMKHHKAGHDDPIKVIHSGGRKHREHHKSSMPAATD